MTRFWRLRCLRVVEVIPEYDICEGDWSPLNAHLEGDGEDGQATVLLGNPSGGCEFDMQTERESLPASDAVTVVLPSRERVRFPGWLRAPRLAAVTLVVLGAGVSIRLLKRPGERVCSLLGRSDRPSSFSVALSCAPLPLGVTPPTRR